MIFEEYLKVKPIDKNFNLSRVKSEIKGFNFDLVITIGAQYLEDLGQVYTELKDSFGSSTILNFDNTLRFYKNIVYNEWYSNLELKDKKINLKIFKLKN